MKLVLKLVAVVVLLLVVAAVALSFYIDAIAKTAIERGGTFALGVPTSLTHADVGITSGSFGMSGLKIANPEGYQGEHFVTVGSGGVLVSLGSLMKDTVELPELTIANVDMHLERHDGKANYRAIIDNLKRFESGDSKADTEGGKKFVIKELLIHNVLVHMDLMGGGELTKLEVPIDEIRLENVGSESDAMVLADLVGVIIKAIFATAVNKAGSLMPADLTGELSNALASLQGLDDLGINMTSQLGELLGGLEDPLKGIGGDIGQAGQDITKGIGNLLGGNKDN